MSRTGFLSLILSAFVVLLAIGLGPLALADDGKPAADPSKAGQAQPDQAKVGQAEDQSGDPLKRPVEEKRKKENAKSLKKELMSKESKDWLDKDVRWIISDEEKKAFMQLSNEEEREQFIEAFWDRRNPNPDSE
jgi:hypothetical protein